MVLKRKIRSEYLLKFNPSPKAVGPTILKPLHRRRKLFIYRQHKTYISKYSKQ